MGRQLRPASATWIFHVLNLANGRMLLFDDEGDDGRAIWIDPTVKAPGRGGRVRSVVSASGLPACQMAKSRPDPILSGSTAWRKNGQVTDHPGPRASGLPLVLMGEGVQYRGQSGRKFLWMIIRLYRCLH